MTTIHVPPQEEQPGGTTGVVEELPPAGSSPSSTTHPAEEPFYVFEDEQPDLEAAFVAPFQLSTALPTSASQAQPSDQASAVPSTPAAAPVPKPPRTPRLSLTMLSIVVCVVVVLGLFGMQVLAQTTPPLQVTHSSGAAPHKQPAKQQNQTQQHAGGKPAMTAIATQRPGTTTQGQGPTQAGAEWVPQHLPEGWTTAGLQMSDAIQALRTAVAFTDREMSLDYRSVGTRALHGGTFTAATFVMTPAARQRFLRNDVRESSNTLFDLVVNTQLIRLVVTPQPQLIQFTQQGQQQFARVTVAFQFWQSRIDPEHPQQRLEGKELDPATKQPRVHHMAVLLVHIPPQQAGNTPAMGGTGWLVSNYALDLTNPVDLDIVQPA